MRRALTSLSLCLLIVLTACSESPAVPSDEPEVTPTPSAAVKQQEFTLPYYPNADLHPILGSNRANMVLSSLVYQGLFELDNTFTPRGVLCSEYSVSEDKLTWTFTLADKTFSDGSPVMASDVVRSLELARGSTLYGSRLADVQSVFLLEDSTVALTLTAPNALLPALLDIPVIRDLQDGSMPLGTGPYRFAEDDGPLRLVREDFAPDTLPAQIPLLPIDHADDLIYAFDAGNVSLTDSDLTGSNALGYSTGYEAYDYPTTTMLYVGFRAADGPCSDPLVRQALSRSFDRDTVAGSLLSGHAQATCLPVSPRSPLHSSAHEAAGSYDPAAAEALLGEAGYARGEDGLLYRGRSSLALTLVVNTDNSFKLAVADYLAGQLTVMGIQVTLQKLAWDDYLAALEAGAFDLYLGEVTLSADFDLSALLSAEGNLKFGGFQSTEMDTAQYILRYAGVGELLLFEQFQADAPFAPLCFKNNSVLTQWQAVSGLNPTRQNPFYNSETLRFRSETEDQQATS